MSPGAGKPETGLSDHLLHFVAALPDSIASIRRRRTTKRRSDESQEVQKHAAVSSSAGSTDSPEIRSVAQPKSRVHHPIHPKPSGGRQVENSGPKYSAISDSGSQHSRRAGHEGEQRSLMLSSLIALKQIVSAALSARAFGNAGSQSGLESLLISTVQHSVAGLLQSHRPDLLPALHGPTPRLAVLDVALAQLIMTLSGGEDVDHMVSTATHGPAARSFMDAARADASAVTPAAAPEPLPPQPTYAARAPVDMQSMPASLYQYASAPAGPTVTSGGAPSHASQAGSDPMEGASTATGAAGSGSLTPPGSVGRLHQETPPNGQGDSASGRFEQAPRISAGPVHGNAQWVGQHDRTSLPAQATSQHEHEAAGPYSFFDMSSLPDEDDLQPGGRGGLDAALTDAGL